MGKVEILKEMAGGDRVTVGELAQAADCTELTIRRKVAEGAIYAVKVGGRVFIPMQTAVAYLKGEKCDEVPPAPVYAYSKRSK